MTMLGLDEGFVEKSFEEMEEDMKELLTMAERQKKEASELLRSSESLRNQSIDLRKDLPEKAEGIWQEADKLQADSKELMRQSVDNKLKANDIKHRLDVHQQIVEVIDHADELWKGAIKSKRL